MSTYLRSLEVKFRVQRFAQGVFTSTTRVAEALTTFEYALIKRRVRAAGLSKVILEEADAKNDIKVLLDVMTYSRVLDDMSTWPDELPVHERYLHAVFDSLLELGQAYKWEVNKLEEAVTTTKERDYRFYGVWMKAKPNASGSHRVGVEWRTKDEIEMAFVVQDGAAREWLPIFTSKIGLGVVDTTLGKFTWTNDRAAVQWHANKRDYWALDLDEMQVSFHYEPAESGAAHGQYALAKMYLDGHGYVKADKEQGLFWLRKAADQGFARAKRLLADLT